MHGELVAYLKTVIDVELIPVVKRDAGRTVNELQAAGRYGTSAGGDRS